MRPRLSRPVLVLAGAALALAGTGAPALAHDSGTDRLLESRADLVTGTALPTLTSDTVEHVSANPGQLAISGCFLRTAPLFVTSGLDSVRVYDVSDPARPEQVGLLANAVFENEAMTCGERRTPDGIERFALIGVDAYQASPDDPDHVNAGGNELIVVDVTDPTAPRIRSRVPATTSTHTVACVDETRCRYAYSAGGRTTFSVLDLGDLDAPVEVDADPATDGTQPHATPTGGHKWNFDAAGYGTHTGWNGSSMWDTTDPAAPRLVTTTGAAGRGEDPAYPGWNDFIHHNSFRPNADAFTADAPPSLANGNVLLVTEEDYEETDCSKAGSFQTWWVRRLDGTPDAIVPLDKVELADLGTYPLPQGAFCSAHWFDAREDGLVAAGFYGGGMQVLDVTDPRDITSHGFAAGGEVWDAMWVPEYRKGRRTNASTDLVYSIDLVRGLDVYAVGDGEAAPAAVSTGPVGLSAAPLGLLVGALGLAVGARRRLRSRVRSAD